MSEICPRCDLPITSVSGGELAEHAPHRCLARVKGRLALAMTLIADHVISLVEWGDGAQTIEERAQSDYPELWPAIETEIARMKADDTTGPEDSEDPSKGEPPALPGMP